MKRMSKKDAAALTAEVRRDAAALWMKLLKLYEGGAHEALDYSSWPEYCEAEFGKGRAHAYRLLSAARVHEAVSLHVDTRGMTEAQARELKHLLDSPDRMREVCSRVKALGGWSRVSVAELRLVAYGVVNVGVTRQPPDPLGYQLQRLARAVRETVSYLRDNPRQIETELRDHDGHAARTLARIRDLRGAFDFIEDTAGAIAGAEEE